MESMNEIIVGNRDFLFIGCVILLGCWFIISKTIEAEGYKDDDFLN